MLTHSLLHQQSIVYYQGYENIGEILPGVCCLLTKDSYIECVLCQS